MLLFSPDGSKYHFVLVFSTKDTVDSGNPYLLKVPYLLLLLLINRIIFFDSYLFYGLLLAFLESTWAVCQR
jgi:hypothetical protein